MYNSNTRGNQRVGQSHDCSAEEVRTYSLLVQHQLLSCSALRRRWSKGRSQSWRRTLEHTRGSPE
jgi:hypothetical protein